MRTALIVLLAYASIITLAFVIKSPDIEEIHTEPTCKSGIYEFIEAYDRYGDDLSFFKCVEEDEYVEDDNGDNSSAATDNSSDK